MSLVGAHKATRSMTLSLKKRSCRKQRCETTANAIPFAPQASVNHLNCVPILVTHFSPKKK
eukprot:3337692-Amphidinium_carterae.2